MRAVCTAASAVSALVLAAVGGWLVYINSGFMWLAGYLVLCLAFYPLAVILHEEGHVFFGALCGMKVRVKNINPFSVSANSVILPRNSRKIKHKLIITVLGGVIVNGITAVAGAAFLCAEGAWQLISFIAPSSLYLFVLNVVPCEYASGKTDGLIFCEAVKNKPCSMVLLRVLEIQGMIAEGTALCEIDENLLFSVPQIMEDEPAFIMLVSLRAEFYRAKGEKEKAAKWESRLEELKGYLPEGYSLEN